MYQKEIEFFWPLTEQMPLDLDYSVCVKPSISITTNNISTRFTVTGSNPTWTTTLTASGVTTDTLTLTVDKTPSYVRKWLYKLLNIKWKLK